MSGSDLKEIVTGPGTLPHRLNATDGTLEFAAIEPADLKRMTFHDGRDFTSAQVRGPFPLAEVAAIISEAGLKAASKVNYIFHSAFCCSTLLARCLAIDGKILSLREPNLMLDLANLKRFKHSIYADPERWTETLSLAISLLAKPMDNSQGVLIKPTNITNNIIPDLLDCSPSSRAILLYSDLRSFLISLIKKGQPGLAYARQTMQILNMDSDFVSGIAGDMGKPLSDLQIIALVWRVQMSVFADVLASFPHGRVASLDSRLLIEDPAGTLRGVIDFYGYEVSESEIGNITTGPLFHHHAKVTGQPFDAAKRGEETQRIEDEFGKKLDQVVAWEKALNSGRALPWPLPHAL